MMQRRLNLKTLIRLILINLMMMELWFQMLTSIGIKTHRNDAFLFVHAAQGISHGECGGCFWGITNIDCNTACWGHSGSSVTLTYDPTGTLYSKGLAVYA